MKFLIIGLGSMGKRRLRNLQELGYNDIIGFDIREDRRNNVQILTCNTLEDALIHEPDVFIISTPPDHHRIYQEKAIELGIPFFTEASILNEGLLDIKGVKGVPSATMLFNPSIQGIKDFIRDIKSFRYYCKSWLPAWHPKEKLGYYAFNENVNGCKEMIPFELIWITNIFGEIDSIDSISWCSKILGNFNDYYVFKIRFVSGIEGIVEIDTISEEKGGGDRQITLLRKNDPITTRIYCSERMYVEELKCFIDYIQGKKEFPHSFEKDQKLLEIIDRV